MLQTEQRLCPYTAWLRGIRVAAAADECGDSAVHPVQEKQL